jgi:hypothetical protein
VGRRIQGVVVRAKPNARAHDALRERYAFRLFESPGNAFWILDFAITGAPDRGTVREARAVAQSYVDAVRVLNAEDRELEQLHWVVASIVVARLFNEAVMGFISQDSTLDFAALVNPAGVSAIGDHMAPYLIRWDAGELTIQPYVTSSRADAPQPPEELSLLKSVAILPAEPLPDGTYPVHGNVTAEAYGFAPAVAAVVADIAAGRPSGMRLLDARGVSSSCWDD